MFSRIRVTMTKNPRSLLTCILLVMFMFTLIGCQSSPKEESPAPPANSVCSYSPDVYQGFNFEEDAQAQVGYIESLSIGDMDLTPDISVVNPISARRAKVVGVLSFIKWDGGQGDHISFRCQVSGDNREAVSESIESLTDNSDVELKFAVYDYDPRARSYYKCFHTNSAKLQGIVMKEGRGACIAIAGGPSSDVEDPENFELELKVVPQPMDQDIYLALSSKAKMVKQWGVKVTADNRD